LALGQPGAFFAWITPYTTELQGCERGTSVGTSDLDRIVLAVQKTGRTAAELTALGMSEVTSLDRDEFLTGQREWFRKTLRENLPDFGAAPNAFDRLVELGTSAFDERLKEVLANQGQEGRG
jgi:hypothetical protein